MENIPFLFQSLEITYISPDRRAKWLPHKAITLLSSHQLPWKLPTEYKNKEKLHQYRKLKKSITEDLPEISKGLLYLDRWHKLRDSTEKTLGIFPILLHLGRNSDETPLISHTQNGNDKDKLKCAGSSIQK